MNDYGGHRRTKSVQSDLPWATEENNLAPVVKQSYNADAPHYRPKARPPELPVPMYSPGPHLQYSPPPQQYNQPRAFQRSSSHKEMYQPPTPIGGAASKDPPTPSGRNPSGKHPSDSCQQYNILTGAVMYQAPAQRKSQAQAQHDMYKPPDVPYLAHAHSAPQQPEYYAPEPKYNNYCPPSHAPPYPPRHPSEANQQYARHSSEVLQQYAHRHPSDLPPHPRHHSEAPSHSYHQSYPHHEVQDPPPAQWEPMRGGPSPREYGDPHNSYPEHDNGYNHHPKRVSFSGGVEYSDGSVDPHASGPSSRLAHLQKLKRQSSVKEAAPPSRGFGSSQPTNRGASPAAPREPARSDSVGAKGPRAPSPAPGRPPPHHLSSRHSSASGETPHHSAHISRMPPRGGASSNHAPPASAGARGGAGGVPGPSHRSGRPSQREPSPPPAGSGPSHRAGRPSQREPSPPPARAVRGPSPCAPKQRPPAMQQAASAGLTSAPLRRAANPVLRTHPQAQEPVSAWGEVEEEWGVDGVGGGGGGLNLRGGSMPGQPSSSHRQEDEDHFEGGGYAPPVSAHGRARSDSRAHGGGQGSHDGGYGGYGGDDDDPPMQNPRNAAQAAIQANKVQGGGHGTGNGQRGGGEWEEGEGASPRVSNGGGGGGGFLSRWGPSPDELYPEPPAYRPSSVPESMPDEHYVDPLRPNTQQKSQWDQRRAADEDYQNPVEVHGQAPPAGGRGRGPSPSPTFDEDPPAPKPKPSNPFDEDQPLPKPKQGGFDRGWDDEEVISPPPMKTQPRARVRMKPEGKPPTPSGQPQRPPSSGNSQNKGFLNFCKNPSAVDAASPKSQQQAPQWQAADPGSPPIRGGAHHQDQGPGSPPILGGAPATAAWEDEPIPAGHSSAGFVPPGADNDRASKATAKCNSCGRTFNKDAYARHAKVCEKVFVQKRKVFNMTAARVEGSEAAKFVDVKRGVPKSEAKPPRGGQPGAGSGGGGYEDKPISAAGAKKAKWKMQSDQLRRAMKGSRMMKQAEEQGLDIRKMTFDTGHDPEEDDDRVSCPHCGRKFAALVAERHMPHCKNTKHKPNYLAAGGGAARMRKA